MNEEKLAKLDNINGPKGWVNNIKNAVHLIQRIPGLQIWFDEFHQKILIKWYDDKPRELQDTDILTITHKLQADFEFKRVTDAVIEKSLRLISNDNVRNECKDWLESLKWDGTKRIEKFFHLGLGTIDDEYTRAASKNFFISMAARTFLPGCQCDYMVILEGEQGTFKTTAIRLLGGEYYGENSESPTSKDFPLSLQGKLIVEIPELSSFSKAEVTAVKRVITCREDRFRPPYARAAKDFPRQCILIGTTNDAEYLLDATGGRRFWPIAVGKIDIKYIRENREQLFAEAVAAYKEGSPWWQMPADQTLKEQEFRRQEDPWEVSVERWLIERDEPENSSVTIAYVLEHGLKIEPGRQTKADQMRAGKVLRRLGWIKTQCGNKRMRTWKKSE